MAHYCRTACSEVYSLASNFKNFIKSEAISTDMTEIIVNSDQK